MSHFPKMGELPTPERDSYDVVALGCIFVACKARKGWKGRKWDVLWAVWERKHCDENHEKVFYSKGTSSSFSDSEIIFSLVELKKWGPGSTIFKAFGIRIFFNSSLAISSWEKHGRRFFGSSRIYCMQHLKMLRLILSLKMTIMGIVMNITGWWFGTMEFYDFPYIGNFIIPTD